MTVSEVSPASESAEPKPLWERRVKEPSGAHDAFRMFRDLVPGDRAITRVAKAIRKSEVQVRRWAASWDWWERAAAWDDECHRLSDTQRLESLRKLTETHMELGEMAVQKAMEALTAMQPEDISDTAAVRLLEFGVKMQRSLVGDDETESDDPWERIADALDPRKVI